MLVLQTMGGAPDGAIMSIGACYFDKTKIGRTFERNVHLGSAVALGMTLDPAMIVFWLKQSEVTQHAILKDQVPIRSMLADFAEWLTPARLYCNGASFHFPILSSAYRLADMTRPWDVSDELCYRTLRARSKLHAPNPTRIALTDAINQAKHLQNVHAEA